MMATEGLSAFGTTLAMGDGASPESFTSIAKVTTITGPALTVGTLDITHHESSGQWIQRIATALDVGTLTLDLNFLPTEATHRDASGGLLDDMLARTKRNFRLKFPDAGETQWIFAAYVTGFSVTAPYDGKLGASVTLTGTDTPTLA